MMGPSAAAAGQTAPSQNLVQRLSAVCASLPVHLCRPVNMHLAGLQHSIP